MSKILGLDLGTNSIGWAVVEREDRKLKFLNVNDYPTKGVIVFPEGVKIEAKTGSIRSRAAERTGYRGARRLKFRRKLRKYETLLVLANNYMCPLTVEEVKAWRKSGFREYPCNENFMKWLSTDEETNYNPYYLRDKFSREKYDWENDEESRYQLGRVFYHLAQRRGFKSNRLEQSDENVISDIKEHIQDSLEQSTNSVELLEVIKNAYNEHDLEGKTRDDLDATQQKIKKILNYLIKVLTNKVKDKDFSTFERVKEESNRYINKSEILGKVKGNIKKLSEEIEKSECETLGQYFWYLYQRNRHNPENKIRTNYTARQEHYLQEFDQICKLQRIGNVNKIHSLKFPTKRYEGLALDLYKAIFYQRRLRSQKGLVGKCIFEKDKPRCPVSRPEFEEFRMWQFINNIRIKTPEDEIMRPLFKEEKNKVVKRFYLARSTFKFLDIAETLFEKKAIKNEELAYYKDRDNVRTAKYLINYKMNTTISGNPICSALQSIIGDNWKTKEYSYQTTNKEKKLLSLTANYKDLWHILFTFEDEAKLREYAEQKLRLDKPIAKKFSKISLPQDYSRLSLKAICKILPWLEKGLVYPHAVFMANIEEVVDDGVDMKAIEQGIANIIEKQSDESKKTFAVNSLIGRYKRENSEYSKIAESYNKDDLEVKLRDIYGQRTWKEKKDKDAVLGNAFALLKQQLNKIHCSDAYAKVMRIDKQVIEFLNGINTDGIVYCSNENRLKHLYHPSDLEGFKPEKAKDKEGKPVFVNGKELEILPLPKTGSIKNPVLMRAMHQLRKLINELLTNDIIDSKTRIHIELSREINDTNKRKAWKQWQDELRDKRENAVKEIKELYKVECSKEIQPTEDDIIRYLLWEEQNKREIYEDECTNISICDIIGPDPTYDFEHTIPRSRSWDNSMMNKTLCSKAFNRKAKSTKTPYELGKEKHEQIIQRISHWKNDYEKLDNEIKNIKPSKTDLERRNKQIVEKHYKIFKRDYWKGKYERFTIQEVPEGFKNSQTTDTGLITRFARNYLSCVFRTTSDNSNVRVVKGIAVSEFRKAWGLQEIYEKKSRSNHIHHCIDAVTIASMTKDKYDAFAEEWQKAEEEKKYEIKGNLAQHKPWPTFTQDLLNLENEVLIVHTHKDNVPKQSKKIERKRGKIIYKLDKNGNRVPRILQGDTVRGALHQETFYGAIAHNENREVVLDEQGNIKPQYVIRKELSKLTNTDIKKIVDPVIQKTIEQAINNEILIVGGNGSKLKSGETIWQNKDMQIPIKKVRIYSSVKNPLPDFKKHADPFLSGKPHKQQFNVIPGNNYCMAIYEGKNMKGKTERVYELINYIDAAEYYKLSSRKDRLNLVTELPPKIHFQKGYILLTRNGKPIKLKKGDNIILLQGIDEDVDWSNKTWLRNRLYNVTGLDDDGIKLYYHQEARSSKDAIKLMNEVINQQKFELALCDLQKIEGVNIEKLKKDFGNQETKMKQFFESLEKLLNQYYAEGDITIKNGEENKIKRIKLKESRLTTPKGNIREFIDNYKHFPYVKVKVNDFNALIQGIDFQMTLTGKIEKL